MRQVNTFGSPPSRSDRKVSHRPYTTTTYFHCPVTTREKALIRNAHLLFRYTTRCAASHNFFPSLGVWDERFDRKS